MTCLENNLCSESFESFQQNIREIIIRYQKIAIYLDHMIQGLFIRPKLRPLPAKCLDGTEGVPVASMKQGLGLFPRNENALLELTFGLGTCQWILKIS
jgi:hypothetical protein